MVNLLQNSNEQPHFFTSLIAENLLKRLTYIRLNPLKILVLGRAQQNFFSAKLHKLFPQSEIDYFEVSQGYEAPKALPQQEQSIDLIVSSLALHHFELDLGFYLSECQRVLSGHGLLLFSLLGTDTFKELKTVWRQIDSHEHVHEFLDLQELGDVLLKMRWVDPVIDREIITLQYENLETFFVELKAAGKSPRLPLGRKGLFTPRLFKSLLTHYESLKTQENKLPVTCEVLYGTAWGSDWKAQKEKGSSSETKIPLSKLMLSQRKS